MLKFQIVLIAILVCCVAFISCDRTQSIMTPVTDDMMAEDSMSDDMMTDDMMTDDMMDDGMMDDRHEHDMDDRMTWTTGTMMDDMDDMDGHG